MKTLTKNSYYSMKYRCLNPKSKDYYNYKDIKICDRWLESFDNFLEDMGERPEGATLDRIEPDKGYYKENCRWADSKKQSLNKNNTKYITYNGETKKFIEFCKELNLHYNTVLERIRRHKWTIERALSTPTKQGYDKSF